MATQSSLTVMVALCIGIAGAQPSGAAPYNYAAAVDGERLDQIMLMPTADDWTPTNFLDLRYPWPERTLTEFKQPFDSWIFAKNANAVLGLVRHHGRTALSDRMADYLTFLANIYTKTDANCTYMDNEFDYPDYWSYMRAGFKGAFMKRRHRVRLSLSLRSDRQAELPRRRSHPS